MNLKLFCRLILLTFFLLSFIDPVTAQLSREEDVLAGDMIKLEHMLVDIKPRFDSLRLSVQGIDEEVYSIEVKESFKAIDREISGVYSTFIDQNRGSNFSLQLLGLLLVKGECAEIYELYDNLSARLKNSEEGKLLYAKLQDVDKVRVASIAPNFLLPDQHGNFVKLEDFRGKYVVIDFWASWCGPCRRENSKLVELYPRMKRYKFEIVGISLDVEEQSGHWLDAISDDQLSWVQLCDFKGWDSPIARNYGVFFIPQNFLVNPQAIVVAKNLEADKLENVVTALGV